MTYSRTLTEEIRVGLLKWWQDYISKSSARHELTNEEAEKEVADRLQGNYPKSYGTTNIFCACDENKL